MTDGQGPGELHVTSGLEGVPFWAQSHLEVKRGSLLLQQVPDIY